MARTATTGNIVWDRRLESFKGRDTARYVTTAVELARTCGACRAQLIPGEPVSLVVDIMQSSGPGGSTCLTFTDCVCHRSCSDPILTVRQTPWEPEELSPLAVRAVLTHITGGRTTVVPVLAYTFVPVVSFREDGGELTSAFVSFLLSHGFQLVMRPDYPTILQQAQPTAAHCRFTLTPAQVLRLGIGGQVLYREQLDRHADLEWIEAAARTGKVLVISGDYLHITDTSLDLHTASRQGTLVIGTIAINGAT